MADPVNRVGETIGGYRLLEEIGRGGFGAVYKAVDPSGRQVALKIALEPRHARHLKNEGRFQERVKHPHAVEVYELRHDHDPAFMAVELVDGETLAVRIKREGRLSVTEALRIATELLSALAVAHDQGIVHRDLKPHNVLLDQLGSVKLFDFGLARDKAGTSALLPSIESRDASKIAGSLPYMAPEQKVPGGQVDARADVYAFGIMLFEMLTGTRPEGGELPTELRPDLDPGLDRLFRGCYARRERRYASAKEVLFELSRTVAARSARLPGAPASLEHVGSGERVAIGTGSVLIGRHPASAVHVTEPWVAQEHASIEYDRGRWLIKDLGSHAGTYLMPAVTPPGRKQHDLVEKVGSAALRLGENVVICLGDPLQDRVARLRFHEGPPAPPGVAGKRARESRRSFPVWTVALLFFGALALVSYGSYGYLLGRALMPVLLPIVVGGVLLVAAARTGDRRQSLQSGERPLGAALPGRPASVLTRAVAVLFDVCLLALLMRFTAPIMRFPLGPIVLWITYETVTTALFDGTVGKWLCGVKVVDAWGRPLGWVASLLRSGGKILAAIPLGLGWLLAAFNGAGRAVHDLFADSFVVDADE